MTTKDTIEIIAAIAGILSAIIAILQYFRIKRKNRKLEKKVKNIASTGVALGYYYNFLFDVFTKLRETKLKIEIYKDDSDEIEETKEYDSKDVNIFIIMPINLSVDAMDEALEKMRMHRKGDIISKGSDRNFGINFMFNDDGSITILDFPKPLNAIREHLLLDPLFANKIEEGGKLLSREILKSEDWKKAEIEEMDNFTESIYNLMERGQIGMGKRKVKFVSVSEIPPEIK